MPLRASSNGARTAASDAARPPAELPPRPASRANAGEAGKRLRVFAISDVHSDFAENLRWVDELPLDETADDVLIVAGDVSDDEGTLRGTLARFRARFADVFFTPGNHDLWDDNDSVDKLNRVRRWCREADVHTCPRWFALPAPSPSEAPRKLWVVPVLSWYHADFDTEPDIDSLEDVLPRVEAAMTDFRACSWPTAPPATPARAETAGAPPPPSALSAMDDTLAVYFDRLNDAWIGDGAGGDGAGGGGDACGGVPRTWDGLEATLNAPRPDGTYDPLISFSHFLPRIELIPEKRFLFYPHLPKAVGSTYLRDRVHRLTAQRRARPSHEPAHMHVFGHTHFGYDLTLDDRIRYVQPPLSYPSERKQRWGSIALPGLERGPVLLFDSASGLRGGFVAEMPARWSEHYRRVARDPSNQQLAPYVASVWQRRVDRVDQRRARGGSA